MRHTSEEIKYRLSDLGVQIGNIAIDYITELEKENKDLKALRKYETTVTSAASWINRRSSFFYLWLS